MIISDLYSLNNYKLSDGSFLFTSEQKTEPKLKIIVQWTNQDENKIYTSPIYTIIIPPQN